MKSANVLVDEHRLIEQALNCLERMAEECARQGELEQRLAHDLVAFFRIFVHDWHFPREEAYLARAMAAEDGAARDDLSFHDHRRCGEHLHAMEQAAGAGAAGDRQAVDRFVAHAHAYIEVLMKHNEDEEDRVYPTVERALTHERRSEAAEALRQVESRVQDRPRLEACVAAAHRLADRFNVSRVGEGEAGGSDGNAEPSDR
jgi:hemerythrin-like domain-containing protein